MSATATTIHPTAGTGSTSDQENKFLSFCLGSEEYGLEILKVREIIGVIDITPLPQTPDYVKGVINLRGKIIPVIELRTKFGLPSVEFTDETCIIVVEVAHPTTGENFQTGVVVDTVREVLDIDREQIEPAPSFGCSIPLDFILGMGKVKDKVIILLNINNIMTTGDAAIAIAAGGGGDVAVEAE
jgi:purine-binding chemotaxis protein CheW